MNKKLYILVVGLLAFSLMGCTQSAPSKDYEAEIQEVEEEEAPPAEVQSLKILEQGFAYSVDEWDDAYANFSVIVENPNTDYAFTGTKVRVSVKNSLGSDIATRDYFLEQMLPEEVYGFGDSIPVANGISKVESDVATDVDVTIIDGASSSIDASYADFAPLKVTQANPIEDEYSFNITGAIDNSNDKTYESCAIGVIFRDASGEIAWGQCGYIDDVLPGETPYSVYIDGWPADGTYATVEAYAHIL